MTEQRAVKIPEIPGKITFMRKDEKEYVRYLAGRTYDQERKYNVPEWVIIGRRSETMPGLMYPNDHYEQYFGEEEEEMNESMTPEEAAFARDRGTFDLYAPFFEALYYECRTQARKRPDSPVTRYKAENLNQVLAPLKEMMQGEDYAELLGLIKAGDGEDGGMNHNDAMILLTQYKAALAKYRRSQI